jgi:hypothetical protein
LIGSFLLGFTYCDAREIGFIGFFSGVSYFDKRERAYMFDYETKEKEHQNNRQSD